MRRIVVFAALTLVAQSAQAALPVDCPADRAPLLIVGTFHMEGSTADLVSQAPADMSTSRRQAEIEALVARLADRVGLTTVSPVDYPMWMDGTTSAERHEPPLQPEAATAAEAVESPLLKEVHAQVAADDRVLADGTVSEFLAYLNRPERAVMNHRWDVISNLAPGKGTAMYETTDHATNWYKRNLRIYTNLVAISGPGERVLFLVGAGHAHILNGIAATDPRFCLVPAAEFLAGG